jgi:hypothetical protein
MVCDTNTDYSCLTTEKCYECRGLNGNTNYFSVDATCYTNGNDGLVCDSEFGESPLVCDSGEECWYDGATTDTAKKIYDDGDSLPSKVTNTLDTTSDYNTQHYTKDTINYDIQSLTLDGEGHDRGFCDLSGSFLRSNTDTTNYCGVAADNTVGVDGVQDCKACYYREEIDAMTAGDITAAYTLNSAKTGFLDANNAAVTFTEDNEVMCMSCADNAENERQYISSWIGRDETFKSSGKCTTIVASSAENNDDDMIGICSATINYKGCVGYTGPEDGYYDIDADSCKEDIRDLVEDYMRPLGITALVVCFFFVGIMFFTQLAIDIWKSGGDDDDEDE